MGLLQSMSQLFSVMVNQWPIRWVKAKPLNHHYSEFSPALSLSQSSSFHLQGICFATEERLTKLTSNRLRTLLKGLVNCVDRKVEMGSTSAAGKVLCDGCGRTKRTTDRRDSRWKWEGNAALGSGVHGPLRVPRSETCRQQCGTSSQYPREMWVMQVCNRTF